MNDGTTDDDGRLRYLRIALTITGLLMVVAIYPLMRLWPSGWAWHHGGYNDYALMIVAVYAVLGIFLIRAARDPLANLSLIWFTVWSSVAHAAVMTIQAVANPHQRGHLAGDIPVLVVIAVVLGLLTARESRLRRPPTTR